MAVRGIDNFEFLPTYIENGYRASLSTKTLEILFVCTSLSYRGSSVFYLGPTF